MLMKILLAEDDFVTRKFMSGFLSKYGECDVTVDGMEAVDAFMMALEDDDPYDLVCLDIMMPVMDGYQALMGIRNLEKERDIPKEYTVTLHQNNSNFSIINTLRHESELPDPEMPDTPQTGDTFSPLPIILIMCLSGLILLIVGIYSRRRR